MTREEEVLNRALARQARPPSMGKSSVESNAGAVPSSSPRSTTVVDEDGNVRRLWTPGDPWTSDYYFGASD